MNLNALFVAVAALATGANLAPCQSAETLKTAQEPMLEFTVLGAAEAAEDSAPVIGIASADGVALGGRIATPNPCYEVAAELTVEGQTLTLVVTATSKGGFCPQMVAAFDYGARITGLASGAYDLVTVYSYPETGWDEKRFQLSFEIP